MFGCFPRNLASSRLFSSREYGSWKMDPAFSADGNATTASFEFGIKLPAWGVISGPLTADRASLPNGTTRHLDFLKIPFMAKAC